MAAVEDGIARLAKVRSLKNTVATPAPVDEAAPAEDAAPEETSAADPIEALGDGGAILVTYAPEIEDVLGQHKALKKLSAEPEVTEALLDEMELALDDLPTQVLSAIDEIGEPSMDDLQAAGAILAERKLVKDGVRFGAFLFLANRLGAGSEEVEPETDEIPMDEDAAPAPAPPDAGVM